MRKRNLVSKSLPAILLPILAFAILWASSYEQAQAQTKKRVGIQAGHWKNAELPDELDWARPQTGTSGGGSTEWQVALDVANLAAEILRKNPYNYNVDVLPATIPIKYQADVFVSLHTDGNANPSPRGYKAARSCFSTNPDVDDRLLALVVEEYGKATQLPQATNVTDNMRCHYSFNYSKYQHAIAKGVPGVLLEMGYLTSPSDQDVLIRGQNLAAEGIAKGIARFLGASPPSTEQPTYNTVFLTDTQLEDYNSMSVEQVRAFLVGQNSYFRQPIPDVDGQTFDPPVIIVQAARDHQINPKVILATLQKESSAVSSPTRPSDAKMRFLMGCVSSSTARQQLDCAAERFRSYHDDLTQKGTSPSGWRVGQKKNTQDGVEVTPATKAVVGQFTYTPYAGARWGGKAVCGSNKDQPCGGVFLFYDAWNRFGFGGAPAPIPTPPPGASDWWSSIWNAVKNWFDNIIGVILNQLDDWRQQAQHATEKQLEELNKQMQRAIEDVIQRETERLLQQMCGARSGALLLPVAAALIFNRRRRGR